MESIFLDKPFLSNNLFLKGLNSPFPSPKHDAIRIEMRARTIKYTSQISSWNNEEVFLRMKMNTTVKAVSSDHVMTDYTFLAPKPSIVVAEPATDQASSSRDHGIGIAQYLHGKNYFITGATGFLAKVFIEKMLRSAPTVGKIYLLIKAEDIAAAAERLKNEIIDSELFICLKEIHGEFYENFMMEKLVLVLGNVCEDNLGMDADIEARISKEVDVIINSAASTSFDERYDVALNTNTKGPHRLMNFAKLCNKLQVFIHISTAFVNGEREGVVHESPFEMGKSIAAERSNSETERSSVPTLDIEAEIRLASSASSSMDNLSKSRLSQKMKDLGMERAKPHGWQSTYVFTKAMGEMMLNSIRGDIPLVILRPSVVESCSKEPIPGWIQGNRMLDPLILSYGKGQLPGFPMDPQEIVDVVPADMVVNATLAALTKHGKASKPGLNIYQISSAVVNPLLLDDVFRYSYAHFIDSALNGPNGKKIEVDRMRYFTSADQNFSSYIKNITMREFKESSEADEVLTRPMSERLEAKCRRRVDHFVYLAKIYEPYMFYRARFDNSNTEKLMGEMSVEEMLEFGFDVRNIDWADYFLNVHLPGLRKHVFKK